MAEAPSYQRLGLMTRSMSRPTDYAARESIATTNNLINVIDNMYAKVSRQAAVEAEYAGIEYGAENPITLQQLKDSALRGEDPTDRFDTSTIFGRAAKASALEVLDNELTYEGRTRFATLDAELKAGKVDLTEYAERMNAVTAGLSGAAQEASPALAAKIRAELGVTAASYFQQYGAEVQKRRDAQLEASYAVSINAKIDSLPLDLEGVLNNPALKLADAKVINEFIEQHKNSSYNTILTKAAEAQYTETKITSVQNNIGESLDKGYQSFIVNKAQFLEDAGEYARLVSRNEKTNNPVVDVLIGRMTNEQRMATAKQILDIERTRLNDIDAANARQDKINSDRADQIKGDLLIALQQRDPTQGSILDDSEFAASLTELRLLDSGAAFDILDAGNKIDYGTNVTVPSTKRKLQQLYARNDLSIDDVIANMTELNGDDITDFTQKAKALQDEENRIALSYVAGQIDYDEDAVNLGENDPNYKLSKLYAKIKGNLHEASLEAKNAGEDFDAMVFAKSEVELLDQEITKVIKEKIQKAGASALASINSVLKKNRVQPYATMQEALDALEDLPSGQEFYGLPNTTTSNYMNKLRKALEEE